MAAHTSKGTRAASLAEEAEALRAVLDATPEALLVADSDNRIAFVNRRLTELFGLPRESLHGKGLEELAEIMAEGLEDAEAVRVRWKALARQRDFVQVNEFIYRGNKRLHLQETTAPVWRSDGSLLGRLLIFRDITREKEIDRMKTEFISIASHELRTPMTSIKGSLDLLLGGFAGEVVGETRELLEIAQSGCERLIRLINDILDLSKIEAGRMQLRLQPMSLFDSVQRSARTIKAYADGFQVKVEIDAPARLPPVWGDRDRIDQIVTNLLGNAVKFSPPGGTVHVELREGPGVVECAVIDRGPGIPSDQLPRIFGKFQQIEGAPKKAGTGLGLAIAHALVQEHKGKIWVDSRVGEGSRFVFQIPLAPAQRAS